MINSIVASSKLVVLKASRIFEAVSHWVSSQIIQYLRRCDATQRIQKTSIQWTASQGIQRLEISHGVLWSNASPRVEEFISRRSKNKLCNRGSGRPKCQILWSKTCFEIQWLMKNQKSSSRRIHYSKKIFWSKANCGIQAVDEQTLEFFGPE